MTPLQREELDYEIEHLDWKPLNRREEHEMPLWVSIVLYSLFWILIGIVAVFAFDKIEGIMRIKWPNL